MRGKEFSSRNGVNVSASGDSDVIANEAILMCWWEAGEAYNRLSSLRVGKSGDAVVRQISAYPFVVGFPVWENFCGSSNS